MLEWAREQGMSIRGLLSAEQLEQLCRVFSGEQAWSFELYEPLRALSHALPRLGLPDLPETLQFGDALAALDALLGRESERGLRRAPHLWQTTPRVPPEIFGELGYARTSAGISRLQDEHRLEWAEHGAHSKNLMMRAAELAAGGTVAVIGAGKLYDIPLRKLLERFERVILIDVDGASLERSVEHALRGSAHTSRCDLVTADVTGVSAAFVMLVSDALRLAASELEAYRELLALLHSFRLEEPPQLGEHPALRGSGCELVISAMVLSQLAIPLTEYAERRFVERFAESKRLAAREFQIALRQLTHRVQHYHLQALLRCAPSVCLVSDVAERFTRQGGAGELTFVSEELPLIGAPQLEELFPAQSARKLAGAEWQWQRVVPGSQKPRGRALNVQGVIAAPRIAARAE